MGFFGEEDAANIPDDPYYVAPNKYKCVVTEAVDRALKDGTGNGVSLKYTIEEPDSEFDGQNVSEFLRRYEKPREELTADERQSNSRLKQRLVQLGVPVSEMNSNVEEVLNNLVGMDVIVEVTESTSKKTGKTYTNISSVQVPEDDDEE